MKSKKKIYWFCFCGILAITAALAWSGPEFIIRESDSLTVNFLDVGQGDAIYIETPEHFQILIDGGPDKSILRELGEVMPFSDRSIDMIVLTHPHSDHVAGLVEVLRRYRIGEVYLTGVVHTSADYLTFLQLIEQENISAKEVGGPIDLVLDHGIIFQFLYPLESISGKGSENLNNTSIINRLVYGDDELLLTGDLEAEGEDLLLASGQDIRSNILKVGHHGSQSSSQEKFLKTVNPDMAIISVGSDNDFGHPSPRTISRLERLDIGVLRTDLESRIEIKSSGQGWEVGQKQSILKHVLGVLDF